MDESGHVGKPVLETLNFISHSSTCKDEGQGVRDEGHLKVTCLLCDEMFDVDSDRDGFLRHLIGSHKFVIGDVKLIADLKK